MKIEEEAKMFNQAKQVAKKSDVHIILARNSIDSLRSGRNSAKSLRKINEMAASSRSFMSKMSESLD